MLLAFSFDLAVLQNTHVESVLQIANEQFGEGFMAASELEQYIDSDTHFCHVVLYGATVVGFSLMQVGTLPEIARKMKGEADWFLQYFSTYSRLAYRSLTAVAAAFKGRGIANLLVKEGLAFLSHRAQVVVCDAWKSSFTHIGKILERNGYQVIKEVPDYWHRESLQQQYQCAVCGTPPCRCTAVFYAKFFDKKSENYWWQRPDLCYRNGLLHFADVDIRAYLQNKQTPFYLYNIRRILDKYQQLQAALAAHQVPFSIYYAIKANRHPAILSHLKANTNAGLDVCSPNELDWAFQMGFTQEQLTYTGTSLADRDLKMLALHPHLRINFDSLSAVRRFAALAGQRNIGIRINTGIGMAYNQSLEYAGEDNATKFGVYPEQWSALKQIIQQNTTLVIDTVHCHSGSGFLSDQLPRLPLIFEQIDAFIALFPTVQTLNLGGGLGVPQCEGDQPLDLEQWSAIVCQYARQRGLRLAFEPGDYLVKDAGILVTQVNTVEDKKGKHWVGIDTGMNMNYEFAYYQMNLEAVPIVQPLSPLKIPTTLCGNINEPIDVFSDQKPLPPFAEGDFIALLNSGGYGASTASNHCMRGDFKEYVLV